jgi:hypothetical protein
VAVLIWQPSDAKEMLHAMEDDGVLADATCYNMVIGLLARAVPGLT